MGIFNEDQLKWPLVVRDDVGDWHSAINYEAMRRVFEPQDLADESFRIWDREGYRIHLHEYFRGAYELRFTRGDREVHELSEALHALNNPSPGLENFRRELKL